MNKTFLSHAFFPLLPMMLCNKKLIVLAEVSILKVVKNLHDNKAY